MFENLSDKLEKAFSLLKGHGRITEINVAIFQEQAREAARIGDWAMTDFYINEARKEAKVI